MKIVNGVAEGVTEAGTDQEKDKGAECATWCQFRHFF